MKLFSVIVFWVLLVPSFAQGVLQIEPDPFEERLKYYATSLELLTIEEIPLIIFQNNDLFLNEAAYQQFSKALKNQLIVYIEDSLENHLESLERLRFLLSSWNDHWQNVRFIPETRDLTAEFIRDFYKRISIIDKDISESIQMINELIDQDRLLTTDLFPL